MQFGKSVKTDANKVVVSSTLSRKDKFNNKAKEVNTHLQDKCSSNNLPLITHNNFNPHYHINVKGLYLNSCGDKQLTSNFINFIENGEHNFRISLNDSYPHQIVASTDRDELLDSFSADATLNNTNQSCLLKTKSFRFENPQNVIVGHLNINSLRHKFEPLKPFIYNAFDKFLVSETRIDSSFPNSQFHLAGYRMFRHDRDSFGGGLCMYVNESIPVKQLNSHKDDSETLFLEINLRLKKRLIGGTYKHPDQSKSVFLESLSKNLSMYLDTSENVILSGDFNMTPEERNLQLFADSFNLEHLIKKPTCFKGSSSCIDFIITNKKAYFKKACI